MTTYALSVLQNYMQNKFKYQGSAYTISYTFFPAKIKDLSKCVPRTKYNVALLDNAHHLAQRCKIMSFVTSLEIGFIHYV